MRIPTRSEVKEFIMREMWGFYEEETAKKIGKILFRAHDERGLPLSTAIMLVDNCIEEKANLLSDAVLEYIINRIRNNSEVVK